MSTQSSDRDPLAEVIAEADHRLSGLMVERIDAAVRAHIAAVLDAEEARWAPRWPGQMSRSVAVGEVLDRLRAALLGTTEETTGG